MQTPTHTPIIEAIAPARAPSAFKRASINHVQASNAVHRMGEPECYSFDSVEFCSVFDSINDTDHH